MRKLTLLLIILILPMTFKSLAKVRQKMAKYPVAFILEQVERKGTGGRIQYTPDNTYTIRPLDSNVIAHSIGKVMKVVKIELKYLIIIKYDDGHIFNYFDLNSALVKDKEIVHPNVKIGNLRPNSQHKYVDFYISIYYNNVKISQSAVEKELIKINFLSN